MNRAVESPLNGACAVEKCRSARQLRNAIRFVSVGGLLLGAGQLFALGLGNLENNSYIGEPLSAQVEILDSKDGYGPSELRVRQVTTREAMEKLNLDLITNHFRLELKPYLKDGKVYVSVSSKAPIVEPFIDFLLELSWTGGQVYREYTLLMDLPLSPAASTARASKRSTPKPTANTASDSAATIEPQFSSGTLGGSYQVKSGDTLSHIAEQWRLGSRHSLKNTEQWLFENNAKAFLHGDRNQLMLGAQIRFPTSGNLPAEGLSGEVVAQDGVRVAIQTSGDGESSPVQEESTTDVAAEQPAPAVEGTLRLGNNSTVASEDLQQVDLQQQSNSEIRDLIHITQETADRIVRENNDLKRRIENIEGSEYIQNMEKLVALQRDEIEQLRLSLEQRTEQPSGAASNALPVATVDEPDSATISSSTASNIRQENNSYSTWFWIITILSSLMALLIAALVSFRIGQKSQGAEPLAVPETAVEPPNVEDPDVADLGPIKTPEDLGDEDIIPLELDDPAALEDAFEEIDLLPEDEALFSGMSNRETVVEVPESLMVDTDFDGLNSVRLPGLVAEELETGEMSRSTADNGPSSAEAAAENIAEDELSFDLELNEEFLSDADKSLVLDVESISDSSTGGELDLSDLEADLFKDNRDDVDELISTAMIFASFGDYDKAEELLINESAHYIDEPRIITALEQLANARKKTD